MISVNPQSPLPVFEQIIQSVCRAISEGLLRPGDRIPPIRDVAIGCGINRNTVAKAYKEMERVGLVLTRPGAGTRVRGDVQDALHQLRMEHLGIELEPLLARASAYGLSKSEIHQLIDSLLKSGSSGNE